MSAERASKVFIGSSSEARLAARYLSSELESLAACDAKVWDQGVFSLSSYAFDALTKQARASDFAVLIASADDVLEIRGESTPSPRDNVLFELGLFMGILGRDRTYLVVERTNPPLHLPSDLLAMTFAPYAKPADDDWRPALNNATLAIREQVRALGPRERTTDLGNAARTALTAELDLMCAVAVAQGWTVKTRSQTTLRLVTPRGRKHTFTIGPVEATRVRLRDFAKALRADGLRVNRSVRDPLGESAFGI